MKQSLAVTPAEIGKSCPIAIIGLYTNVDSLGLSRSPSIVEARIHAIGGIVINNGRFSRRHFAIYKRLHAYASGRRPEYRRLTQFAEKFTSAGV
jgi:hypothetical protein